MRVQGFKAFRFPPCPAPDAEEIQIALSETVRIECSKSRVQQTSFSLAGTKDADIKDTFVDGLMADGPAMAFCPITRSCVALDSGEVDRLVREWEEQEWIPRHKVHASASAKNEKIKAIQAEHLARVIREAPQEIKSASTLCLIDFERGLLLVDAPAQKANHAADAATRLLSKVQITSAAGPLMQEVELPGVMRTVQQWILEGPREPWSLGRYCTLTGEDKDRVAYANHDMDVQAISKYLLDEGMQVQSAEVVLEARIAGSDELLRISGVVKAGGAISRFTITNEEGNELEGLLAMTTFANEMLTALDQVCESMEMTGEAVAHGNG